MEKTTRKSVAILLLCIALLSTGCWDRREIEDMGMVVGVAIDKGKGKQKNRIVITNQFVNTLTGKKEEATVHRAYNLESAEKNVYETAKYMSTLTDNTPYYTHLKVIVISEDIASSVDLMNLINWFLRDRQLRRTINIVIAKGSAKEILKKETEKGEIPSIEIWGTTKNYKDTAKIPIFLTIGEMGMNMTQKKSYLIQLIEPQKKWVKLSGAAVISGKERKLIGWLNDQDMFGLKFLQGGKKAAGSGVIPVIDPETKNPIVYEYKKIKSTINPIGKGDQLAFDVKITSECLIDEDWNPNEDAFKEAHIKKAEKLIESQVKVNVEKCLAKMQKKLKADVVGFGTRLKIQDYKTWKRLRDNWDQEFSKASINVSVKIHVREFGGKGKKKI
ncbi:UNVERIFIED_CONTAM: spore germination protein [Brevibacillus sp. OAP136]